MMGEFCNKVAVVSGAAQGIGVAVCEALLEKGARVAGIDIQFSDEEKETERCLAAPSFSQWRLDVSQADAVDTTISQIEKQLGAIDYLVSAAGILRAGLLHQISDDDWRQTLDVNLSGAFYLCRRVTKSMQARKRGVVVAVASNAANTPRMSMGSYAASKAGLCQMIKCFGLELAADGIRCNSVSPGSTDTPMQRQLWQHPDAERQLVNGVAQDYRLGIPLQRIAQPSQIADAVMFLLSSQAAHITMTDLVVDGGATLGG